MRQSTGIVIFLVLMVVVVAVGYWLAVNNITLSGSRAEPEPAQARPEPATALVQPVGLGTHTTAMSFHWACLSKDKYTQILGLVSDPNALKSVLASAVFAKECRLFNADETVVVVDTSWGDVLLQWSGETAQWWTSGSAVR